MATEWDDGSGRIADAVLQRIEQLEAALLPAKNTLNAVRILMKNQDRREHEQRVYEAVQICCEAMEDVFTPSSPPEASD
jgi:uncharacterized membrane protein